MRVAAVRRVMGQGSHRRIFASGSLLGVALLVFMALAAQGAAAQQRVTVDYLNVERSEGFASRRV